jgi:hypothetical protein
MEVSGQIHASAVSLKGRAWLNRRLNGPHMRDGVDENLYPLWESNNSSVLQSAT